MRKIYLDNNATTPIAIEVKQEMEYCFDVVGNPSSRHWAGQQTTSIIQNARKMVADFIGAFSEQIIFTSGGTEANNLAIFGSIKGADIKSGHLITTQAEHNSVLKLFEHLQSIGYDVTFLPVQKNGILNLELLKSSLTHSTRLVSIHFANNETGVIQPIQEIAEITAKHEILFHTDAVQAVGKIPISVETLGMDLLTLSGHKFYGPKGVGAVYFAKGVKINPILFGSGQELGKRPGTENIPAIAGLGKACETCKINCGNEKKYLQNLRDRLEIGLLKKIPDIIINGTRLSRLPNTLNVSFPGVPSEVMVTRLDLRGIAVSSGAACSAFSHKPSHVLRSMKLPPEIVFSAVRFSPGIQNTEEEIDFCVNTVVKERQSFLKQGE